MHLALDKDTGDLIKQEGGGVARVDSGRFVVQQVQSKLRTRLGGWFLDPDVGWLSLEDFEKGFDKADIERRAREIILKTQGVFSIDKLNTTYDNRKVTITFKATTAFGVIDLTVPWGK